MEFMMFCQPLAVIGNLAAAVFVALLAGPGVVYAQESHSFTIKNNSGGEIIITSMHGYCVKSIDWPRSIAAGETATINWVDSNNGIEIEWMAAHGAQSTRTRAVRPQSKGMDGVMCANSQKWVDFQVDGYQGTYGMVHRKIDGDWYNGQFWATSIQITSDGLGWNVDETDVVPDNVSASCSHSGCFGKFSEMAANGKDSYNWPRLYRTEDGYQFQIN